MKIKILPFLASVTLIAIALTGCASMGASKTTSLLDQAGFHQKMPETPAQKKLFAETPAYKLERITFNGKTFYAYKDEKRGVAYVGDDYNYQTFEKLVKQHQLNQSNYQAAQMNSSLASGWYNSYAGAYYAGLYSRGPRR